MKRRIGAALLLAVLLFPLGALALTQEQRDEADKYFLNMFYRAEVISGAVLINRAGQREYAFYYGGQNKSRDYPVTDETVFKVASVSKLISAVGVMRLVEEGKLDLDAPLHSDSGQIIRNPFFPESDVTLRQAMSHTTSLLPTAPYTDRPRWDRLDQTDKTYFGRYAPGSQYRYANLNGGILCSEAERVTGLNFNDYMAQSVFAPLGINAAYAAHLLPDPSKLANTYRPDGIVYLSGAKYMEQDEQEFDPACDPGGHYRLSVGGLYISLAGLEKIGIALAGNGTVDGYPLLSAASVRLMRRDQAAVPGSSVTGESPYGLCVYRFTLENGQTWYGHQGRWEGLLADIFWEPENEAVMVFVMNGLEVSYSGKEVASRAEKALNHISDWLGHEEPSFVVEDD